LSGLWLANVFWLIGRLVAGLRELTGYKKPHVPKAAWRDIWIGAATRARQAALLGEQRP
jgi:hypothetical protein